MKILSPAGDFESLKIAVNYGADEVYLGVNDFNARNNIDGFNLDNLKNAVDYAHVFGVKVLLAINILFTDAELQSALNIAVDAYNLGVDALIVQDLGLVKLLSDNYPQIELHASTQMGIHNLEGVNAILKYGFKRMVLARETPLSEIKRIKDNCDIEIEYFAQGALCVSFSGNCYLSSYLCGASGNRGRCKQLCRLPYSFEHNGKSLKKGYLLSAKDFNLSKRLSDLKKAGVDIIKIEGRARRPFYVGMATREYYNALHGGSACQDNLKLAFNREYTEGYFNGNGGIISDIQNHIGIYVGKVVNVKYGKNFNEVFLSSDRKLTPKSVFKFFCDGKEKATVSAYDLSETSDGLYRITTTQKVSSGDTVRLIVDAGFENAVLSQTRKVAVNLEITALADKPIKAVAHIGGTRLEVCGDTCISAKNQPLTKENIAESFKKHDFFYPVLVKFNSDNVFITKGKLNEFRRKVYEAVYIKLTEIERPLLNKIKIADKNEIALFSDFFIVESLKDGFGGKNVIYSPERYVLDDIMAFKNKCAEYNKNAYLDTPNFALAEDISLIRDVVGQTGIGIIANNYYALGFDTEIIIGAGLNVYNAVTAAEYGKPVIVAESGHAEKMRYPYMTLRHCPLKSNINCKCEKCLYDDGYAYRTDGGKILKLKRKKLSTCTFYLTD